MTDAAALGLAWYARRQANQPESETFSRGRLRIKVIAPLLSSIMLVAFSALALLEVPERFRSPHSIETWSMCLSALYAIGVNYYLYRLLRQKSSLNERAAALHILGDIAISTAVVVGSLVITFTGWQAADPLLSVAVGTFVLRGAWHNASECIDILMERTPRDISLSNLKGEIEEILADTTVKLERLTLSRLDDETLLITTYFERSNWDAEKMEALTLHLKRHCPDYQVLHEPVLCA
jgi:cobalt-zinc-cadmium efflux system protein